MNSRISRFVGVVRLHVLVASCVVAGSVILAGWALIVRPIAGELVYHRMALSQNEQEYKRMIQERATFDRLQKEIDAVAPQDFEKIDRIVPVGRDVPHLIVELESLASETGVLLTDINVQEDDDAKAAKLLPAHVKPINVVITVAGADYAVTKRFLDAIEKNARLLDVKRFTFAKGVKSYTINLTGYYKE